MNEAMYHQEKWSRDVVIPSLYMHYYSVVLNTRQDWIGNRRRDGMRWFAYNGQEDRICNQVLWERLCQVVRSSVWRWHERFCTILLLDEATSALDRENQNTFLTALRAWRINGARWWQWQSFEHDCGQWYHLRGPRWCDSGSGNTQGVVEELWVLWEYGMWVNGLFVIGICLFEYQ